MPLNQDNLIFFLVIFGGSLVQGFTGFGFSLISLPILFLIFDPKQVIFMTLIPGCTTAFINFMIMRKSVPWKEITPFFLYLLLGLFVTGVSFEWIPVLAIKFLLWFMLCYTLASRTLLGKIHFLSNALFCGISAGLGQGAIGIPGPAAVSYTMNQPWSEEKKKAGLVAILSCSSVIRFIIYLRLPQMHQPYIWNLALFSIPVLSAGLFVGQRLCKKLNAHLIKTIVDILLAIFILTLGFEIAIDLI